MDTALRRLAALRDRSVCRGKVKGGGGGADGGAGALCPLEHYKHWAGVILIGSSLAPRAGEEPGVVGSEP